MATPDVLPVREALPTMQRLAAATWRPDRWQHPGQLVWSAYYGEGLDGSDVALWGDSAWAWAETDEEVEVWVAPGRPDLVPDVAAWAAGRSAAVSVIALATETDLIDGFVTAGWTVDRAAPWFTTHTLPLSDLPAVPEIGGYRLRAVRPDEAQARAACHRAAWSPTSRVTSAAYRTLMTVPPYRPELDWVAVDESGTMVASCSVWYDVGSGSALVEPVGTHPDHGRRGLAAAVSLAALSAAREAGATVGLVRPRGDDGYPVPQWLYRSLGFRPGARSVTLRSQPL